MLAEPRDITRADASVKAGRRRKDFCGPGREIGAGTVGLIGLGHVGRAFAERMRGFGARLIAYDLYVPDAVLARYGVMRAGDLDAVFRESDVVQLFARLTAETERFIGARHFALMKPTAYFVNAHLGEAHRRDRRRTRHGRPVRRGRQCPRPGVGVNVGA
ncbi:NAD(P)-dependent oxidoreductase [Streptomyces sp.]|uniref:NAD(P)-dependent oxidoreductase n=1 Tax=Streptomyces sp. TaxID=1931 RepID=UPI002D76F5E5|nr:NAD(P)-dependent oxidoreductase [Streptomyces sp.]HET6358904.1 NAD(P)-dependent oxidoreductase [Streptomyces sp.]